MTSESEDGYTGTLSSINTPSIRGQLDMLSKEPPMSTAAGGASSPKKGMFAKLRKAKGTVDIEHTFKHVFGKQEFKGKQREVMDAAIGGLDILVIAPTGMGKSLCFQVPAVAEEHGLTIVITPLISLMENQVHALQKLKIRVALLTSKTSEYDRKEIERDIQSGHPRTRLLYITPERLAMGKFQALLKKVYDQNELSRLVIDEAHCISEWGHDFRKEYQQIGKFRELFEKVPIMALTASATKTVQDDIITSLDMRQDRIYRVVHSFNRVNLFYEVRYMAESFSKKIIDITTFINNLYRRKAKRDSEISEDDARTVSGIIYCRSKKSCDQVAEALRKKGINAAPFHRGLKDWEADKNAQMWRDAEMLTRQGKKRVDCIVATVAFGMGIDTPSCRYVIHFDLPTSFEGFYQETGRAGRDGHASRCLIYYSRQDAELAKMLVKRTHQSRQKNVRIPEQLTQGTKTSLDELIKFIENTDECRHIAICKYFGEKPKSDVKKTYCDRFCDVCKAPEATKAAKKALDPPELVATQMPAFEKAAEETWSDAEDEEAAANRLASRTNSTTSVASGASGGLPGFEKASKFSKKRPLEQGPEDEEQAEEKLAGQLFPAGGDENGMDLEEDEDFVKPQPSPLRHEMELEEDEDFMKGAEDEEEVAPVMMMMDDKGKTWEPKKADERGENEEAATWQPRRRPSKIPRTSADPAETSQREAPTSIPPFVPPAAYASKVGSPSKPQQPPLFREPIEIDDSEEEEDLPMLPRAPSPKKMLPSKSAPGPSMVKSLIAPKALLGSSNYGIGKSGMGFQAPFKNTSGKSGPVALAPFDVDVPTNSQLKFVLVPDQWTKKVDRELRKEAIRQLHALLTKAFLVTGKVRAKSEERELFDKMGVIRNSSKQKEDMMLHAALEIESDAFWMSITSSGFKTTITRHTTAIKGITRSSTWLDAFPTSPDSNLNEVFQAVVRAVKLNKVHTKLQNKFASSGSDDGEDSD